MTMTSPDRRARALQVYSDTPLKDGDAVLLVDDATCLEIAGLADHWRPELRRNLAAVLRSADRCVLLAIARRGADLTPADYGLWRDLHHDLRDASASLLPVQALPAA